MNQLTNLYFENINIFNHKSLSVNITKNIIFTTCFNKNFNEYMFESHMNLNKYLTDNNYNSQSQKVIRVKINEYLILLYLKNKGITNLYPQS
ncbi:hypothetical protein RS022_02220 [Candidatus Phytoplasma rubi]|uniref:Uncharacterized protein n=1 Tax=Candidatus Phytoplasma rubi TaxID=399025 RepID=A0ABY7BR34_9MOLU|nr:hypothetical protein RS022_02220 [Candidatus Phytoplasma rubi]